MPASVWTRFVVPPLIAATVASKRTPADPHEPDLIDETMPTNEMGADGTSLTVTFVAVIVLLPGSATPSTATLALTTTSEHGDENTVDAFVLTRVVAAVIPVAATSNSRFLPPHEPAVTAATVPETLTVGGSK